MYICILYIISYHIIYLSYLAYTYTVCTSISYIYVHIMSTLEHINVFFTSPIESLGCVFEGGIHSKTADRRRCDLCPSNRRYVNLLQWSNISSSPQVFVNGYPPGKENISPLDVKNACIFEDRWFSQLPVGGIPVFICREGICFERFLLKDEASSIEWTLRPMMVAYSRWPLKWWMSPHGWGIFAEVVDRKQRLSVEWASWPGFSYELCWEFE